MVLLPVLAPHSQAATAATQAPVKVDDSIVLSATIERTDYTPLVVTRPAQTIVAPAGVTVASLAAQYHVDAAALRWANDLRPGDNPQAGSPVLLPPGPGALVKVQGSERPSHFARRLGIDPRVILDYNRLLSDAPLQAGSYLQVPVASAPSGALNSEVFVPAGPGTPEVPPSSGYNSFPYGQCTYYVASRRDVTQWGGNAVTWWWNAKPYRPEGHVPIQGAIIVFSNWPVGHVAYVEAVNPDGSFVISEMNYFGVPGGGWGRVDRRTLTLDTPDILGFIY